MAAALAFTLKCMPLVTPKIIFFLQLGVQINILLAVFNLIPIPPLDGSRIVLGLLPRPFAIMYAGLESVGIIIIMFLLFTGLLTKLLFPILEIVTKLFGI